jgi:predicted amidohydrolase
MSRTVTVSAVQFEMRELDGFDAFAAQVRGLIEQTDGSDVVVFPELVTEPLFTGSPIRFRSSDELPSTPTTTVLCLQTSLARAGRTSWLERILCAPTKAC